MPPIASIFLFLRRRGVEREPRTLSPSLSSGRGIGGDGEPAERGGEGATANAGAGLSTTFVEVANGGKSIAAGP
jgi:hypothetical protein